MLRTPLTSIALSTLIIAGGMASTSAQTFTKTPTPNKQLLSQSRQTAPRNSSGNISIAAVEQSTHQLVNKYRASKNLPPLTLDARISEQARLHSQAMANGRVTFGHDGFDQRVKVIRKSISNYRGAAENVAYNQGYSDPADRAVRGWINSSGHRQNMEGQYNLTGIGAATNSKGEVYFTQIFIRS